MIIKDVIKLKTPITHLAVYFEGDGNPAEHHEIIGVEWGEHQGEPTSTVGKCSTPDKTI